jgi:hypothetical protein
MASAQLLRPILAGPRLEHAEVPKLPEPCRTKQHSDSEWVAMYPQIERLYVLERRKLRDVMATLEREYGFKATYDSHRSI